MYQRVTARPENGPVKILQAVTTNLVQRLNRCPFFGCIRYLKHLYKSKHHQCKHAKNIYHSVEMIHGGHISDYSSFQGILLSSLSAGKWSVIKMLHQCVKPAKFRGSPLFVVELSTNVMQPSSDIYSNCHNAAVAKCLTLTLSFYCLLFSALCCLL